VLVVVVMMSVVAMVAMVAVVVVVVVFMVSMVPLGMGADGEDVVGCLECSCSSTSRRGGVSSHALFRPSAAGGVGKRSLAWGETICGAGTGAEGAIGTWGRAPCGVGAEGGVGVCVGASGGEGKAAAPEVSQTDSPVCMWYQ
jgi:hypothetical protein